MSSFIVGRTHIDVLLRGMIDRNVITAASADEQGRDLWRENLRSVAHAYPNDGDGDRPGPCSFRDADVEGFEYTDPAYAPTDPELRSVADCYSYQSCEHDEWEQSHAFQLLERLYAAIGGEKGPKSGPWEWCAEDVARARIAGHGVARY